MATICLAAQPPANRASSAKEPGDQKGQETAWLRNGAAAELHLVGTVRVRPHRPILVGEELAGHAQGVLVICPGPIGGAVGSLNLDPIASIGSQLVGSGQVERIVGQRAH